MRVHLPSLALALLIGATVAACGDDDTGGGTGSITGTVIDHNSQPLAGVTVSWDAANTTTTDAGGFYTLDGIPAGEGGVSFTLDWFTGTVSNLEVTKDGQHTIDMQMQPHPMGASTDDLALAATHNASFDWTTDRTSVVVMTMPTRAQLDRALYYQNPALYQDPTGETSITPGTLPSIATPSTFDFPIPTGATNAGQQALDLTTVVDAIGSTPLQAQEIANTAVWEAAVEGYLLDWDLDQTTDLFFVGLAVRDQRWGAASGGIAPQEIVNLYIAGGTELWVKVVFQPFVDVGADVTDTDGDGLPEVYARIAANHINANAFNELRDTYTWGVLDTIEMRDYLLHDMDELYSVSNPAVISPIGVPYEVTGTGLFDAPFAVVGHGDPASASYVINVLLMDAS